MKEFELRVTDFCELKDLNNRERSQIITKVKIEDMLLDFLDYYKINPRDQNLETKVSKMIKKTLMSDPGSFQEKNSGISISAESVVYDKENGVVKIKFSDIELHGIMDGGHTYKIICNCIRSGKPLSKNGIDPYVIIKFYCGYNRDEILGIIEALNSVAKINTLSTANQHGVFDSLKEVLKDQVYADRIVWKKNQPVDGKGIDGAEIVSIVNMFNPDIYDITDRKIAPTIFYISKESSLKKYMALDDIDSSISKMASIIPKIIELRDCIETTLPEGSRKYMGRTYSKYKGNQHTYESLFFKNKIRCMVPNGFIFPILSAFRLLVQVDSVEHRWKTDPIEVWKELKERFLNIILDEPGTADNIGKRANIYNHLADQVELYLNRISIEKEKEANKRIIF